MKNRTSALNWATRFLAVAMIALVVSCKKSDDPVAASNAVAGNWKIAGLLVKEGNDPEQDFFALLVLFGGTCFTDLVFTFNANGTLSSNNPASCKAVGSTLAEEGVVTTGKWALVGTKMTLTDEKGVKDEYDYSLSGDIMSLTQTAPDPTTKIMTKTTLKFKKA